MEAEGEEGILTQETMKPRSEFLYVFSKHPSLKLSKRSGVPNQTLLVTHRLGHGVGMAQVEASIHVRIGESCHELWQRVA